MRFRVLSKKRRIGLMIPVHNPHSRVKLRGIILTLRSKDSHELALVVEPRFQNDLLHTPIVREHFAKYYRSTLRPSTVRGNDLFDLSDSSPGNPEYLTQQNTGIKLFWIKKHVRIVLEPWLYFHYSTGSPALLMLTELYTKP